MKMKHDYEPLPLLYIKRVAVAMCKASVNFNYTQSSCLKFRKRDRPSYVWNGPFRMVKLFDQWDSLGQTFKKTLNQSLFEGFDHFFSLFRCAIRTIRYLGNGSAQ